MSLKEFQIFLDSPVYYTGQKITGRLLVQLTKAKQLKGIRMTYSGCGVVEWKVRSRNGKIVHKDEDQLLNLQQPLFGYGEDECELAAGRHMFPFYCQLPSDLPCSYRGKFGRIVYTVKAKISGNWRFYYNAEQAITVLSVFDLNCLPIALAPVSEKKSKKVGKRSQMLHMSFDLPVRGFVPGQIIPISVSLNNESMLRVKNIIATLRQSVGFRVDRLVRRLKVHLCKTQFAINEGFGFHEALLNLQVPALPPSYLEFCRLIEFRYHLTVEAKIATVRKNLKIHTEVLIGNVPLMMYQKPIAVRQPFPELFDSQNPSHSRPPADQDTNNSASFPRLAMYGNFSSPTYERFVGMKPLPESDPDPVYPVYKFTRTGA